MHTTLDPAMDIHRSFSARRPLLGLTILMVEDSRICCEAVRLMCLKSGARLRRADSLRAARRHLATYRPSAVLVDLGLPDGSGLDLIREFAARKPAAPVLIATSGDDDGATRRRSLAAGAAGFLPKPLKSLAQFQDDMLHLFPDRHIRPGGNLVHLPPVIDPDPLAKTEDLRFAVGLLQQVSGEEDRQILLYCAQFLRSVAAAGSDIGLAALAAALGQANSVAAGRDRVLPALTAKLALSPAV